MIIIGVSGKMGCGKTTFANHLVALLGDGWFRASFADLLKQEVAEQFEFPPKWCYSEEGKQRTLFKAGSEGRSMWPRDYMTVRQLLQWYGTDYRRALQPDYWVAAMRKHLITLAEGPALLNGVVIDDVRFPDELEICDIKIRLEPYPGYKVYPGADHASETALDDVATTYWDYKKAPELGFLHEAAYSIYSCVAGELL